MLRLVSPDDTTIRAIQNQEQSYYFSALTETILQQFGVLYTKKAPPPGVNMISVFLRGTIPVAQHSNFPCLLEGPLPLTELDRLGIGGTSAHADVLTLSTTSTQRTGIRPSGRVAKRFQLCPEITELYACYPKFYFRHMSGREFGAIEALPQHIDGVTIDGNREVHYQYFHSFEAEWMPVLWVRADGAGPDRPIVLTDGIRTVCGFSILDIIGSSFFMPSAPIALYENRNKCTVHALKQIVLQLVEFTSACSGIELFQIGLWPEGFSSAFTIRHDYDRLIDTRNLESLLKRYADSGVKCTWYAMLGRTPVHQLDAIRAQGHEVALHTKASTEAQFRTELQEFAQLGYEVSSVTAHGGTDGFGILGERQLGWLLKAKVSAWEILGFESYLPAPLAASDSGTMKPTDVLTISCSEALEASTDPRARSLLQHVREQAKRRLSLGMHMQVLNHPDLRREELFSLLDEVECGDVWLANIRDISDWTRTSKFSTRVACVDTEGIWLSVDTPLSQAAVIYRGGPLDPGQRRRSRDRWERGVLPVGFSGSCRVSGTPLKIDLTEGMEHEGATTKWLQDTPTTGRGSF